jgi:hypothetical protein
MKVHGRCHCGAITYEAEVEPGTMSLCHCRDCQTLTGSAFRANILAPAAGFRMLSGAPREYVKVADSGARRVHAFCGTCGAPVYSCGEHDPPTYSLRVGALDERDALGRPSRELWTRRRLAWMPPLDGVPGFDGQPARSTAAAPQVPAPPAAWACWLRGAVAGTRACGCSRLGCTA